MSSSTWFPSRRIPRAATCSGRVTITVRLGKRTLRTRDLELNSQCRYHTRIRITGGKLSVHRATRLTASIHYLGNGNLQPARATRHLVAH